MRTILAFLCSLVSLACSAQIPQEVMQWTMLKATNTPASGEVLLVSENFEGTGNPGWTTSGTVDYDYTTTALAGSQSAFFDGTSASASGYTNFTASSELWVSFMFRYGTMPTGNRYPIQIRNGTSALLRVRIYSTGLARIYASSVYASTVGTMSPDTTYYCWLYYKKGTGADQISSFEFQTTNARQGSGNNYAEFTNGELTGDANNLYLTAVSTGFSNIVDNVKVSNVTWPQ